MKKYQNVSAPRMMTIAAIDVYRRVFAVFMLLDSVREKTAAPLSRVERYGPRAEGVQEKVGRMRQCELYERKSARSPRVDGYGIRSRGVIRDRVTVHSPFVNETPVIVRKCFGKLRHGSERCFNFWAETPWRNSVVIHDAEERVFLV